MKGVAVALVHITIVLSLGAKLLYDRAHYPRVWVQAEQVDPDLPIRGRYVALQIHVKAPWFVPVETYRQEVRLSVENNQLIASRSEKFTGLSIGSWRRSADHESWLLNEDLAFFIPEHAKFPSFRGNGEELWVEVTIPGKGPPRPIQLAAKRGTEWYPMNVAMKQEIPGHAVGARPGPQFCQFTFTDPVPLVGTVYVWFAPFSQVTVPLAPILMNLNWIPCPAGTETFRNQLG